MIELPIDKIELINKSLKRYNAEYDSNRKMVEFEGNVYTIYNSIDYDEEDGEFFINVCNSVKLKGSEIEKFHKELHFTTKLVNKLNGIINSNGKTKINSNIKSNSRKV
jgi:hypothetical protein